VRKGLIGKIGENMAIRRFKRYAGGGALASYLHGTRIGVIVEYTGDEVAAKDVAMHVAAMKPAATNKEELDPAIVAQERATLVEAARAEGKPENIIENILKGQLAKFFAESCFLEQGFVKDPDITINQLLELKGKELGDTLTVTRFVRFGLGE